MSTLSFKPEVSGMSLPTLRRVDALRPLVWLRLGWRDLVRAWPLSLGYGVVFALLGGLLLAWARQSTHLTLTLLSGFLLLAPFLAISFYAISSRLEHGLDSGGPLQFLTPLRRNPTSIGLFAVLLAFILSAWERISALLVGLLLRNDLVATGYFNVGLLFSADHWAFVVVYLLLGAALAALVFALAVVSLPMMMDREVDTVTAITTSLWAVASNPLPMLVWAAVIVGLSLAGMFTALFGMVLVFPLLGHASWHAYRDLVQAD
ncbi:MAG: DUF2189 domain-containing protein [Thiobacillaceae bacterium]|jgi:uncharacterized membrane protein|nr:DUF2189 domain-containing protein [Thiobacillaceae bacterium]